MTAITISPPTTPTQSRQLAGRLPGRRRADRPRRHRRQTRAGAPFLRLTLADRSGSVAAVLWDPAEDAAELAQPRAPIHVLGRFAEHPRYGRQVTMSALAPER